MALIETYSQVDRQIFLWYISY